MPRYGQRDDPALAAELAGGTIGVLKTDTLYGIVASARHQAAVERVYQIRGRTPAKPCIILIADTDQLLTPAPVSARHVLAEHWPGPVSIILPVEKSVPEWLHRGSGSLAYRVPADEELRRLLGRTGPLIAPSANPEGRPPARNIEEAKNYFGDGVDFYVDSGSVPEDMPPSQLLRVGPDGSTEKLR